MGLIARLHARLRHRHYVWSWRMRYWWLDTSAGAQARIVVFCFATLIVVLQFIGLGIAALAPRPAGKPQESIIWWVVYVIVMLIAAAVSYAMRPKAPSAAPTQADGPTTVDGQSVMRFWGTHWIDDEFLLAWKIVGRDPIKASGGK